MLNKHNQDKRDIMEVGGDMKRIEKRKAKASHRHFWSGWAKAFDLFGTSQIITVEDLQNGPQRDALALRGDWCAVGMDLRRSMDKIRQETVVR
jgi:hypothetical protein